jgi:eukaryotic-like serine/threonine-protein kinase
MTISPGARLGPYEILAFIGAGGMGEVYRARDTRLDRTVAIKVLNSQLVANAELRASFERETKIISQLQHSHICVHDVAITRYRLVPVRFVVAVSVGELSHVQNSEWVKYG